MDQHDFDYRNPGAEQGRPLEASLTMTPQAPYSQAMKSWGRVLIAIWLYCSGDRTAWAAHDAITQYQFRQCETWLEPTQNPDFLLAHFKSLERLPKEMRREAKLKPHYKMLSQNAENLIRQQGGLPVRTGRYSFQITADPKHKNPSPLVQLSTLLQAQRVRLVFNPKKLLVNMIEGQFSTHPKRHGQNVLLANLTALVSGQIDPVLEHELCHARIRAKWESGSSSVFNLEFSARSGQRLHDHFDGYSKYLSLEELECMKVQLLALLKAHQRASQDPNLFDEKINAFASMMDTSLAGLTLSKVSENFVDLALQEIASGRKYKPHTKDFYEPGVILRLPNFKLKISMNNTHPLPASEVIQGMLEQRLAMIILYRDYFSEIRSALYLSDVDRAARVLAPKVE
ncbi:MAG: hypothetical protein AB7N80_07135 [Bdellovibrionales bacterium]